MKKAVAVVLISLFLTVGIFFAAQTLFGKTRDTGELQITSIPEAKMYLDDHSIGNTPICRCAQADNNNVLAAGDYTVKLVPTKGDTTPFIEHITITKGVLTVVDHTFGATGLSNGSTLQLVPMNNATDSNLVLTSFPSGAIVFLDGNSIGESPVDQKNPTDSNHVILLQKKGYTDKTLHVRTSKGYELQATVYLAIDPKTLVASTSAEASSSATLSPSPTVAKVTILDTPTGFLRVRADASLGGAEVEEVKPGDQLYLLDEKDGWYQVKLPDDKIGWISIDYARKNQ